MMFGYKEKPNFTVENEKEISTAAEGRFRPDVRKRASKSRATARKHRLEERCSHHPALLLLALSWVLAGARRDRGPPAPARVTDLTGTLSIADIAALSQIAQRFEARKGSQIAVLIVPTTEPETIEQYLDPRRRGLEARAQEGRRRRDPRRREERPPPAHRGRLRPRGRAHRRDLASASSTRSSRRVSARRLRRRHSTPGVDRMIRVIDGEPLPAPAAQRPARSRNSLLTSGLARSACAVRTDRSAAFLRAVLGPRRLRLNGGWSRRSVCFFGRC